jgi:hypothetical protein
MKERPADAHGLGGISRTGGWMSANARLGDA